MAHFAKLGVNNVVLDVFVVRNEDTQNANGVEDETIGIAFLKQLTGHESWRQTSYNGTFRKNYATIGGHYDSDRDAFITIKPFPSWALDEITCKWNPPVPYPDDGQPYVWNEELQQWEQSGESA